jgi:carbon monoxide dehydrogenase subunit G
MNTIIESRVIEIHQEVHELIAHYSKPSSFKALMPPEVLKFEANDDSFIFGLKGLPEVKLKVEEISDHQVMLKSAGDKLQFYLRVKLVPHGKITRAQIHFEGEFNPMLKMMVQRPLQTFVNHLADNMERIH